MSLIRRINNRLKSDETTGFGASGSDNSGRFYNKSGIPNVRKKGLGWFESVSWYHTLISMPISTFMLLIFCGYISLNLVFTLMYATIGIEHLIGVEQGTFGENLLEMFFFSTQTFTTVGYGRVSPSGFLTNSVATFEAFLGLLSFALATGLFFARFSKAQTHLRFSENALISPFKEGLGLMFRMAPSKNNLLSEAEVRLTLAIKEEENGILVNRFYSLDTQISRINMISLSWTVVHPITDSSPLYNFSEQDIIDTPMELLVFVKAFDEVHSNQVMSRTSYMNTEIVYNAKFKKMYRPDEKGVTTILDFELLDSYEKL